MGKLVFHVGINNKTNITYKFHYTREWDDFGINNNTNITYKFLHSGEWDDFTTPFDGI